MPAVTVNGKLKGCPTATTHCPTCTESAVLKAAATNGPSPLIESTARSVRGSLATTFLVTAAAFGGLSLVGYTTKKDLTGMGTFLIMGVIGLIIAMIVNMFLQSGTFYLIISGLGVLIFAGLIAYDTQRLKMTYYALGGDQNAMGVATGFGALSLFINFVNLFQFLLAFMGGNRN